MLRLLQIWLPPVAVAVLIFVLSSRPALPGLGIPHADKVAHVGIFALLSATLYRSSLASGVPYPGLVAFVVAALYGVADEWHQAYVPGRTQDVLDVLADSVGALIGVGLLKAHRARRAAGPPGGAP